MAYEKQTFIDGETVLMAEHLNHIEDGISVVDEALGDVETALDSIIAIQTALIGGESK